jgi:hypothetical protein
MYTNSNEAYSPEQVSKANRQNTAYRTGRLNGALLHTEESVGSEYDIILRHENDGRVNTLPQISQSNHSNVSKLTVST